MAWIDQSWATCRQSICRDHLDPSIWQRNGVVHRCSVHVTRKEMSENTNIEWADHTANFWEGCQKVSPGCDHCYAEARLSLIHI